MLQLSLFLFPSTIQSKKIPMSDLMAGLMRHLLSLLRIPAQQQGL
jgi:hypothetical protein